ncbi:tripartite tricarboxylate transporter TctB family protein [Leucobacter sp. wl10]|uniref:tripartite tricarboxylate transporter TctB family protein n=1 Tax=Leucobacter sp. wl10 TaxID=2304677 RepID=UPI000E5BE6E8|nr:tripartite tricarboxylate transporter TctB family protein [Leucobacter sp. wl10]RGE21052.1 tripartite tricarboxylate transporter TctB family protein [Leucobacter sp. wl10]
MTPSNNPTSLSAVVGEELELGRGSSPNAVLVKHLVMPAVLVAFASYLLVGILTMRVPEGVVFPGPQFLPSIIAAGLYLFAALLIVRALRERAEAAARRAEEAELSLLTDEEEQERGTGVGIDWGSMIWIVGSFVGFTLLLPLLGWIIAAALLFWCVARAFGAKKRPVFNMLVGLTASSLAYIAFDMLLGLSLPSGILGWGF